MGVLMGPDIWDERHALLARLFATLSDGSTYRGYKPDVREAPNSDTKACPDCGGRGATYGATGQACAGCANTGRVPNADTGKRYLHVAPKYHPPQWARDILALAHYEACAIAELIGVPDALYPRVENGTLRVLEYPSGTGTAEHTDFDLFTVNLWRSTPEDHEQAQREDQDDVWTKGAARYHTGRIGAMIGLGPAVKHRVPARDYPQRALVYFAMPANGAVFPGETFEVHAGSVVNWSGRPVSEWLNNVYNASRVYA